MDTAEQIQVGLNKCKRSPERYPVNPAIPNVIMTAGVKWLCDHAKCFWLADAIATHQPQALKNKSLKKHQFWCFKLTAPHTGVLLCETGTKGAKPVITQAVKDTDFPLNNIRLYCMPEGDQQVIMLPAEDD